MKTEQVNLRLEADLIAALEEAAREESLDRGTMIRKLLLRALSHRCLDRALERYQFGEISIGRAVEESGLTHWEILEHARRRGMAHPLDPGEVDIRLRTLMDEPPRVAEASPAYRAGRYKRTPLRETLPDRPPRPGGLLLIGINPAPASVQAGHYYQGRIGKRLWRRLTRLGLLTNPIPGAEDDAFVRDGHGLTDIVKRPTRSAAELSREELRRGVEELRRKVLAWRPGLILFAFKEAARAAAGTARVSPGQGPPFEGVPTFLLSGPFAPGDLTERADEELRDLIATTLGGGPGDEAITQRITARDVASGILRLPEDAKRYFPKAKGYVAIILRGKRLTVAYDPRPGPRRKRSGVLRIGRQALSRLVKPGERLRVSKARDGSPSLG